MIKSNILDDINAFGAVEWLVDNPPADWLVYGPKPLRSAVVVWMRPTGYYNYRTLTLFGVWLADGVISVGVHQLPFSAAHFNPESYFHHIRRDFRVHYGDVPNPPDEPLYQIRYDPAQRLTIRREIQKLTETFLPDDAS